MKQPGVGIGIGIAIISRIHFPHFCVVEEIRDPIHYIYIYTVHDIILVLF